MRLEEREGQGEDLEKELASWFAKSIADGDQRTGVGKAGQRPCRG